MYGKIYFNDFKELAAFLRELTGSTAIFEVKQDHETKRWVLEFTGGY